MGTAGVAPCDFFVFLTILPSFAERLARKIIIIKKWLIMIMFRLKKKKNFINPAVGEFANKTK